MNNKMKELYEKKFTDLKLSDITDAEKITNALDKFSEENLLLPEAWETRLQIEEKRSSTNRDWFRFRNEKFEFYCKIYKPILKKALLDFYSEKLFYGEFRNPWFRTLFSEEEEPFDRILNYSGKNVEFEFSVNIGMHEVEPKLRKLLSYPHSWLGNAFQWYIQYSESPMTNDVLQMYHKNTKHYEKIEASKNDLNEWFNAVTEVEDERFVIQNVECKISENPFNSGLWKNYIQYLLPKNQAAANEVYCRYRRLFTVEEKSFEFSEIVDQNLFHKSHYLESMKFQKSYNEDFEDKNYQFLVYKKQISPQTFTFRSTIMHYLIKNASAEIVRKLYQSCKYFFFKIQKPICHSLFVGKNNRYLKHSLALCKSLLYATKVNNLWISNYFKFYDSSEYEPEKQLTLLSNFLPKIAICDVRFILIRNQNISVAEYQFLTKSKRVEKIDFWDVLISDEDNNRISLEQLLYSIPNAYRIGLFIDVRMTEKTENFLSGIKCSRKIDRLYLQFINAVPKEFHHEKFINFLKKNVKLFKCRFLENNEATEILKNEIKKWETESATV